MNTKAIFLSLLLVVSVLAMFGYSYYKNNVQTAQSTTQENSDFNAPTPYDGITRIDAKQFYIDGVHTLVGEVAMPTQCDLLTTEAQTNESDPSQVNVAFSVINNAEFCPQVITPQRFMVSVKAQSDAIFIATLQGRIIELNLIPAGAGETPDDFELFIKG